MWYYGAKYGKDANPKTFWTKYKTSSEHVKDYIAEHGEPDVIQIRKIFGDDVDKCVKWETRILTRINARSNTNFLNRHNGGTKFRDTDAAKRLKGTRRAYDMSGKYIGRVSVNDSRWADGSIQDIHLEKFLTAASTHIGSTAAKLNDGTPLGRVALDDPRWKTGEIITLQTGVPQINHRRPVYINHIRYNSIKEATQILGFSSLPKIIRGQYKNAEKYGIFDIRFDP